MQSLARFIVAVALFTTLATAAAPWAWLAGCDWPVVAAIGKFVFSIDDTKPLRCEGAHVCSASLRNTI